MSAMLNYLNVYLNAKNLTPLSGWYLNKLVAKMNCHFDDVREAKDDLINVTEKITLRDWNTAGDNINSSNNFVAWLAARSEKPHAVATATACLSGDDAQDILNFLWRNRGINREFIHCEDAPQPPSREAVNGIPMEYVVNHYITEEKGLCYLSWGEFKNIVSQDLSKVETVKYLREVTKVEMPRAWELPEGESEFHAWAAYDLEIEGGGTAFKRMSLKDAKDLVDWMLDNKEFANL